MDKIENTLLYLELKNRDEDFAYEVKKNSKKIIPLLDKKISINFPNYTNHDITHSINIINTMHELIKDKIEKFNALELAMMIYSAVFHDIGMALKDKEINKIKKGKSKYLFGKDFKSIKKANNDNADLAIQEIIRVSHGKIANELITTKYKEYFKLPNSDFYFDEELGKICQSHNEYKNYIDDLEDNWQIGSYSYNAKFIAILLRVADILDIDGTRTPLKLYDAINLNKYSDEEWKKNLAVTNTDKIYKENNRKFIRLYGKCKEIKIHRKLLTYIGWIEDELSLAVNMTAKMDEKYQIIIDKEVENLIKPEGYTIPDLKLNMDYHAVTNLLMGESIYGSKDMGLRELVQNSIDACMIKKEKLDKENPNHNYTPTIDINIDEKNNQVIIEDNGIGMNEHIIKNYFLNVGKSYYKSKDFLDYKHEYSPIGNFGIGFLSCFMLSPEVKVITKYFGESKKYEIDLEQSSEYISFKAEDENIWESGTKIKLDNKVFKETFTRHKDIEFHLTEFLQKNILIEGFDLNINGKKVENQKEEIKADFKIDLSEKMKGIEGYIYLDQKDNINKIDEHIKNGKESYYFDGEDFHRINSFDDLDLSLIHNPWSGTSYFRIPLLNEEESKKIKQVRQYGHDFSFTHELQSYEYINIFISNKYDIIVNSGDPYSYEFELYIEGNPFNELKLLEEELKLKLKILKGYSLGGLLVEEFFFKYEAKSVLSIINLSISSSRYSIYSDGLFMNGIKLDTSYTKGMSLINIIKLKDYIINIKNKKLKSNISRKSLIEESQQLLNNAIGELISRYILENFNLTAEEKILVQKFIKEYYPEKSILLK